MEGEVTKNLDETLPDEIRVPITVSKFLLREGDVLDQNVLYYNNLKKGKVLTKSDISIIQQLDEVTEVKVLRLKKIIDEEEEKEKEKTIEVVGPVAEEKPKEDITKLNDVEVKMGFTDSEADRKISLAIKKTIEKIRGEDYQERVNTISNNITEKLTETSELVGSQKLEFEKKLEEVARGFADVFSMSRLKSLKKKEDVISTNFSNKSITNYFYDLVIADKLSFINGARSIIVKLINSFGDDNGGIILSGLLQYSDMDDYVVSHSMFVMGVSILIAKELTKMVYEKVLNQKDNTKINPSILKAVSTKVYDFESMINLGLAALLHDIGIRKNYGIITPDTKITDIRNSKIQLHPSESSFFAQRINTDVFVQRAIYEHHEYLDGSGYPRGIMRYMSRFSPILTFAERFSELVLNNPFIPKPLPPAIAINHILKNEINKFDKDVVFAFIRGTSVYPIGSWVELSNGIIGLVSNISPKDKSKQIIKYVFTSDLKKLSSPTYIDLAENPDVKITRILNPIELSMKVGDLRVYYFD